MRTLFITLINILMLASCTKREAMLSNEASNHTDSLKFCIAVIPVMDCLPFYYAQHKGMLDTLGFDVRLLSYPSMMDADTALLHGRAQMAYTAMPRLRWMEQNDSLQYSPVVQCTGTYHLMLKPKSKIKKMKQLSEKLVALSRNNTADWWSDRLMHDADMPQDAIFRPQFNDVSMRTDMLTRGLVDAAILPQPHATVARLQGCRQLRVTPDSLPDLNVFATRAWAESDTLRHSQLKRILQVYDQVAEMLNNKPDSTLLHTILSKDMKHPLEYVDSIALPRYHKATPPTQTQRDTADVWLAGRTLKP